MTSKFKEAFEKTKLQVQFRRCFNEVKKLLSQASQKIDKFMIILLHKVYSETLYYRGFKIHAIRKPCCLSQSEN